MSHDEVVSDTRGPSEIAVTDSSEGFTLVSPTLNTQKILEKAVVKDYIDKPPKTFGEVMREREAFARAKAQKRLGLAKEIVASEEPRSKVEKSCKKEKVSESVKEDKIPDVVLSQPYAPPRPSDESRVADVDAPMKELALRELCRRRLLPFVERFRPKYEAGWVHKDICRRIEKFVKDVEEKRSPRLLLMMPPRSGKSELSSRHTPAWILGKHPDWEIIAASHTSSLALSFSRYIRDLMRDPAYLAVFPDALLDARSQSVENWNLTGGGGYLAAGVGTGITGRGAHVLILDDLVKDMEAASSTTIRDNTWEWYMSTAYTRLAPGGGVLGLMTWWHEDDWAGRIQRAMESGDGDEFEVVKYPAINEYGDEYILESGQVLQIPGGQKVPEGAVLTRRVGTAVHPARYSTQNMLRIKRNLIIGGQKKVWDALYQQNPLPDEGNFFENRFFNYYGTKPNVKDLQIYQAWDFAISEGSQSDYTVGACVGQDSGDNLYLLDLRRFKMQDGGYIVDEILDFAAMWDAAILGFEDGQIWRSIEFQFKKRCDERRQYLAFELLKPLTDKMVRAGPLRGRMQLGKVYFDKNAGYFTDLQKELLHFPQGRHDDMVDALSWATRLTLGHAAPRRVEKQVRLKSWRDKLKGLDTTGTTHLAA